MSKPLTIGEEVDDLVRMVMRVADCPKDEAIEYIIWRLKNGHVDQAEEKYE